MAAQDEEKDMSRQAASMTIWHIRDMVGLDQMV